MLIIRLLYVCCTGFIRTQTLAGLPYVIERLVTVDIDDDGDYDLVATMHDVQMSYEDRRASRRVFVNAGSGQFTARPGADSDLGYLPMEAGMTWGNEGN